MYNRYVRRSDGGYERVPGEETSDQENRAWREERRASQKEERGEGGIVQKLLRRLHLEEIDTGDILLLLILLFLFSEGEDDELLIALGILLLF